MARRSGVSPAAPAHHFGDAAGQLAAVAKLAFDGQTDALHADNARGGGDPLGRLCEQGVGCVGFALAWPGRFALMFRTDLLSKDTALVDSAHCACMVLENGIRDLHGLPVRRAAATWRPRSEVSTFTQSIAPSLQAEGVCQHHRKLCSLGSAVGPRTREAIEPMHTNVGNEWCSRLSDHVVMGQDPGHLLTPTTVRFQYVHAVLAARVERCLT